MVWEMRKSEKSPRIGNVPCEKKRIRMGAFKEMDINDMLVANPSTLPVVSVFCYF